MSLFFNFELWSRYALLSRRVHVRHLLIVLCTVALLAGSSLLTRFLYYDRPDKVIYSKAWAKLGPKIEIVSVGASLIRSGIKPSLLSRAAVNLAPDATDYRTMYLLLRSNIDRMRSVRWAIVELDNLCLLGDRINASDDYGQFYDLGGHIKDFNGSGLKRATRYLTDNAIMYPIIYKPQLSQLSLLKTSEGAMFAEAGFMAFPMSMTPAILAQRNLLEDEGYLNSVSRSENLKALRKIIDLLERHNIGIVFLRMPQNHEYASARSARWQESEEALLADVCQYLGRDPLLLDMRFTDDLNTGHFSDSRHLNHDGAMLFTRLLDLRLQEVAKGYKAK